MINHIYIQSHDEKYAPPEQDVLEVGLSGDVAFLEIGSYDETFEERKFTAKQGIGVPVADLINALKVLALSQEREDLKRALGTDAGLRAASI